MAPALTPTEEVAAEVLLLLLPCERSEDLIRRVADNCPGISVRWYNVSSSDGNFISFDDVPADVWEGVTMLCSSQLPRAELLPYLKLVQLTSAGSDQCSGNPLLDDPISHSVQQTVYIRKFVDLS